MELDDVVRRRHMSRSFADRPLPHGLVDSLVASTLRAPSAGNTRGTAWVVLQGREETGRYWLAATSGEWRARARRWPGLSRAPVVAVSLASPAAYLSRYAEDDKATSRLDDEARWPVPYWFADAAFCVHTLLLGATAEGLGACFLGNFRNEQSVLEALRVPGGWRLFGAVALGYPDGEDAPSSSLARTPGPRVHRGSFAG